MFFRDAARDRGSWPLNEALWLYGNNEISQSNRISARALVFWPETLKILSAKIKFPQICISLTAHTAKSVNGGGKNRLCFWKSPLGFISDCYKMLLQLIHQPKHPFFRNGFVLHSNFGPVSPMAGKQSDLWASQPRLWLRADSFTMRPKQCQLMHHARASGLSC